jgi:hypothetical protein
MALAPETDYRQEQNMFIKPRSGRVVLLGNASRKDSLGLGRLNRTFRRPHTEV